MGIFHNSSSSLILTWCDLVLLLFSFYDICACVQILSFAYEHSNCAKLLSFTLNCSNVNTMNAYLMPDYYAFLYASIHRIHFAITFFHHIVLYCFELYASVDVDMYMHICTMCYILSVMDLPLFDDFPTCSMCFDFIRRITLE